MWLIFFCAETSIVAFKRNRKSYAERNGKRRRRKSMSYSYDIILAYCSKAFVLIPWGSHQNPMEITWDSHGSMNTMGLAQKPVSDIIPTRFPWDPHGTPVVFLRCSHGRSMKIPWEHHGNVMGTPWQQHGSPMVQRKSHGSLMGTGCSSESHGRPMGKPWD